MRLEFEGRVEKRFRVKIRVRVEVANEVGFRVSLKVDLKADPDTPGVGGRLVVKIEVGENLPVVLVRYAI